MFHASTYKWKWCINFWTYITDLNDGFSISKVLGRLILSHEYLSKKVSNELLRNTYLERKIEKIVISYFTTLEIV